MERLSAYEKETIITFNEEEKTAVIFTYNRAWQQHLEKKLKLKPTKVFASNGREYEIEKKRISMPRAPKKLSDEAKKKLAETLKKARESKKTKSTKKRSTSSVKKSTISKSKLPGKTPG